MRIDLRPFAAGIDAGAKIVMTSHIIFSAPSIANGPPPCRRSSWATCLRGELGFGGLVVSDSMNMRSMKRNYDPADAAIQAFKAGVDLMMLAEEHYDHDAERYLANQRALIRAIVRAVDDGLISPGRVDDALRRILRLKIEAGFFDDAAAGQRHRRQRSASRQRACRRSPRSQRLARPAPLAANRPSSAAHARQHDETQRLRDLDANARHRTQPGDARL